MGTAEDKDGYGVRGIVPIVNTPFDDALEIDFPSLGRLLERAIADGVAGCIVPAVASEVGKLSEDERRRLLTAVQELVAGRIDVVAGVSDDDPRQSLALAEHAVSAGCTTVLCRVPAVLQDDADALIAFYRELDSVGMKTLMIQDLSWDGSGLDVAVIKRLYDAVPSFRAIKIETVMPGAKYSAVLDATDHGLHVSCGWGLGQMVEALDRGVSAFNTTAINLPFVRVFQSYADGDREGAKELFARTTPMLIWCQQHIDVSIHFLKRYCVAAGLFTTANVREPIAPFDATHERWASELVRDVIELEEELRAVA
jgi:4-hydroxy-tetrahydrodipicolinate synthase